jgi:hypothetical protein
MMVPLDMPVLVSELAGGLGIVLSCYGEVSGRELMQAHAQAGADPEKVRNFAFGILDQTRVSAARFTPQDVQTAAAQDRLFAASTRPGFVVALIATTDYQFGLCRMWQLLTDDLPWRTCVFRDPRLARNWLREEVRTAFQIELPETVRLSA